VNWYNPGGRKEGEDWHYALNKPTTKTLNIYLPLDLAILIL
jgi:hypothetical protein